ncbi:MAG: Gfo/Idh/MocA family oxidoreductase [Pseudobutyrivibrio sp.]|nr:Gfo/Idh/MocA family oxidoreductase [Pseudobutyrivibrio sp.]
MNFAIIGAGGIARKMSETVKHMPEVNMYAISARDLDRAQAFAKEWGYEKAYGSYEEMLADDQVELVYIALPHSHHHQWSIKAMEAGKHVLCEKAFAVNERQTREMIAVSKKTNRLLAEAIWTRYMPSRQIINDLIKEGTIGQVKTISANLGYKIDNHERIMKKELAGGALLDLTVYPLNFSSMIMGDNIKEINASCIKTETGVDGQDTVMLEYENGVMASLYTSIYTQTDRRGMIYGTNGFLEIENINNPQSIKVYDGDRANPKVIKEIKVPEQITGYEYEVRACIKAIEEGKIECPEMPHDMTIEIMRQMDEIRKQFGIDFGSIE